MKKIIVLFVAVLLMATNVYALNSTSTGSQHIQSVYVTDMGDMISGDVVILKISSPTYWGKEVTGTTAPGLPIYGVVVGDPSASKCADGGWINVQIHGYCPIIKLDNRTAVTAGRSILVTGEQMFSATSCEGALTRIVGSSALTGLTAVTGTSIALESKKGGYTSATDDKHSGGYYTIKGYLTGL